jgi:hypothetical protein
MFMPHPRTSAAACHAASRLECAGLIALCAVGLALRWWRLDLMAFRYDAAEALARARQTVDLGYPPLTGIVNSLGFRNPAGLEWVILPAVLISPDPRAAAAWIGLLVMSGMLALWWAARQLAGRAGAWAAAALYVFLPQTVFSSRDVWAQHLLIPAGAWSLAFALRALAGSREAAERASAVDQAGRASADESRARAPDVCPRVGVPRPLLGALALAGVATTIHLCAALWFAGLFVWLTWFAREGAGRCAPATDAPPRKRPAPEFVLGLVVAVLVVLALVPSFLDWRAVRANPAPVKPPHIAKFELSAPAPKAFPGRLSEACAGIFDPLSSLQAASGIEKHMPASWQTAARGADVALLLAALLGVGVTVLAALARRPSEASPLGVPSSVARLLVLWIFAPPVLAGAAVRYPNATYFYFALPAVLLLVVLGVRGAGRAVLHRANAAAGGASTRLVRARRGLTVAALALVAGLCCFYAIFFVAAMLTVARVRTVNGPYYTPLREQLGLVREFDRAGLGRGNLVHLGGPWFQRSYDYLIEAVLQVPMRPPAIVIEDLLLRRAQPTRQRFIEGTLPRRWGSIRWQVFPTQADAWKFADEFYSVPVDSPAAGSDTP